MFLSIIKCDDFGIFNYYKFIQRVSTKPLQMVKQKSMNTPEFLKHQDNEQFYITNKKQINHFLYLKSFSGRGSTNNDYNIYFQIFGRLRSFTRVLLCLPANGQRTRSNAKTCRVVVNKSMRKTFIFARVRRNHYGKKTYLNSFRKITRKTKSINNKVSVKVKQKGPTKRSKDKKKSVWA